MQKELLHTELRGVEYGGTCLPPKLILLELPWNEEITASYKIYNHLHGYNQNFQASSYILINQIECRLINTIQNIRKFDNTKKIKKQCPSLARSSSSNNTPRVSCLQKIKLLYKKEEQPVWLANHQLNLLYKTTKGAWLVHLTVCVVIYKTKVWRPEYSI